MSEAVAKLVSVNVGLPREITWRGQTVLTGIWKEPVDGPRRVGRLNVEGDGQGDREGHGGEQRAVFVYQLESYRYWQGELRRDDFTFGQFGENFTVEGLSDADVCIGDQYRIGSAHFEVTQPRVTCYRVGIRMDEARMAALLVAHGRPGFYFRVLEEGDVRAGDEVIKTAAGPEAMTVAEINALLYLAGRHDVDGLRRALRIPALSPGWQASLRALLDEELSTSPGGGGNPGLAPQGPPPAWPGFRALRVAAKRVEHDDMVVVDLESGDGQPLARAQPGQFITLRLGPGAGGSSLVRSYSLAGAPSDAHYRIGVKVEPHGAAGHFIRTDIGVGDRVDVGAPRGSFILDDSARPVVLASAGVGVTPMLAMLHGLREDGSTREIWWIHGARNRAEHAFAEDAASLLGGFAHVHRRICYSRPGPADRVGRDYDVVGHVTAATLDAAAVPPDGEYYLCGPTAFMESLRDALVARAVPAERVHTEIFGAHAPMTPGVVAGSTRAPHPPDGTRGIGPRVTFARSGLDAQWSDAHASILELAEACDVPVRWSCRAGVCHTCETGLVDGRVEYEPEPLESPAVGNLLLCCARPETDLTLDL